MRPSWRIRMLNADEYRVLKRAVVSRKFVVGKVRRAKMVSLSNQGDAAREIASRLECNERTALKWIGRFKRHSVAGLREILCERRPRVYGPEGIGAVIQAVLIPRRSWAVLCLVGAGPPNGLARVRWTDGDLVPAAIGARLLTHFNKLPCGI